MYHELNIYDGQSSDDKALEFLFKAINLKLDGISCPIYFVPLLKHSVPKEMILSVPIDYPNGMSDSRIKNHAIMSAIRKGATAVDVVLNPNHITNGRLEIISDDLKSHKEICESKNIILRVMLEYRTYHGKQMMYVASIIADLGIQYVFPSTGHLIDNYLDNLTIAADVAKKYPSLNIITNGNIWQKSHYTTIVNSGTFGVRFNSIHAVENCFTGV